MAPIDVFEEFNDSAPMPPVEPNSPQAVMLSFQQMLMGTTGAIPLEQAKNVLQGLLRSSPLMATILEDRMNRFINENGLMDQSGIVRTLADAQGISPKPESVDPALVRQASNMLTGLGIDDPNRSLATGLASNATSVSSSLTPAAEPEVANTAQTFNPNRNAGPG